MPTKAKLYDFAFFCKESGELEHVNSTPSTFKCPACGLTIKYLEQKRKFGSHGKTDKTIGHELRVVKEL